ncbi:MAG: hypothetical protein J6U98_07220 [Abditibacteriota bacterium]|nr:hypothetical protein [Abditibacteriota bacterium]
MIDRALRISLIILPAVAALMLLTKCLPAALGWVFGGCLSMGIVAGYRFAVSRMLGSDTKRGMKIFVWAKLLMFILTVAFMAVIVKSFGSSAPFVTAFCFGVVLTQSVIVAEALGGAVWGAKNSPEDR